MDKGSYPRIGTGPGWGYGLKNKKNNEREKLMRNVGP